VYRSALKHTHPASAETSPQTARSRVATPIWLWLPSSQGEPPEADPAVWEANESPSSVSQALVTPECVYAQSVEVVAMLPALSTEYPLSAPLSVSAALSPPEADSPLKRHAVLLA